jgi:hypothetical protein
MAGLNAPWASRDDARFWLQMAGLAGIGAVAMAVGAALAWALLLQPLLAWWHGGRLRIASDGATWARWAGDTAIVAAALFALFFAFWVWYCDGMLRGSGKAAP